MPHRNIDCFQHLDVITRADVWYRLFVVSPDVGGYAGPFDSLVPSLEAAKMLYMK
jgi:hypothetical protein